MSTACLSCLEVNRSLSSVAYVYENVKRFNFSDKFENFSRVELDISDDKYVAAGTTSGRTLTGNSPWATKQAASDALAQVQGFSYQPYTANSVALDPAAELGDEIFVLDVFSGIYTMEAKFGKSYIVDISAPSEEETDHEFPYEPKEQRESRRIRRRVAETESRLDVQADQISAKVSSVGANSDKSFGWSLTDDSWKITANNTDVLTVTKNGLSLTGKITAKSGEIGNFEITSKYLSFKGLTWSNGAASGVYIGERGIKLGQNFQVDLSGRLIAESGAFRGSVSAGMIEYGGDDGTLSGSGITASSLVSSRLSSGIRTSLGYADFANGVFNGINTVGSMKVTGVMEFQGYKLLRKTQAIMTPSGGSATIYYIGWE